MEEGDISKIESILRNYAIFGVRYTDDLVGEIQKVTKMTRMEIKAILTKLGVLTLWY